MTNCVTEIYLSYKREFNFTAKMETFINVNFPFVRVSDLYSINHFFDFSHQTFLENCYVLFDLKEKFKNKEPNKSEAGNVSKTENEEEEKEEDKQTTIQKESVELLKKIKNERDKIDFHDEEIKADIGKSSIVQYTSIDKESSRISTKQNCKSHFHYRRGVYPYSTQYYEVMIFGEVNYFIKSEEDNQTEKDKKTANFSLKLEGDLNCTYLNQIPNDIIKINSRTVTMKPVQVNCESNETKKDFFQNCDLSTIKVFNQEKERTIDITFDAEYVQRRYDNKLIYKVKSTKLIIDLDE
jgi:hypothetical protein